MSKIRLATCLLVSLSLWPQSASGQSDRLFVEQACPAEEPRVEKAFLPQLVSALLPGVVTQGLTSLAGRLARTGESEQVVGRAGTGEYLYNYEVPGADRASSLLDDEGRLSFRPGCLVFASRPVRARRWPSGNPSPCADGGSPSPLRGYGGGEGDTCALLEYLRKKGYADGSPPGTLLVADVEESADRTAFRLRPTYLFYAASPGEERLKARGKKRRLKFSFSFSVPDSGHESGSRTVAVPSIEFDRVVPGVVRGTGEVSSVRQDQSAERASEWYPLPSVGGAVREFLDKDQEYRTALKSHGDAVEDTWGLVGRQRRRLGEIDWEVHEEICQDVPLPTATETAEDPCQVAGGHDLATYRSDLWLVEQQVAALELLADEEVEEGEKEDEAKEKVELRRLKGRCEFVRTSAMLGVALASACEGRRMNRARRSRLQETLGRIVPVDISVVVSEEYGKPFRSFAAAVLSEKAVQQGVTNAVVRGVDPISRDERRRERAAAREKEIESYEQAVAEALRREVDYEAVDGAADSAKKRKAEVDVLLAKVRANRLAQGLGWPLPFPELGVRPLWWR